MGAMEPQIQYVRTSDGVSIAYWTMGEGGVPLLLSCPMLFTHASFELRHPALRPWYERLAATRMIVRYDLRGQGLSQRNVGRVQGEQYDRLIRDFEEVVDHVGLEQFDTAGFYGPSMTHIAYAAHHPERVRRLVLWSPSEDNSGFATDKLRAVLSLIESDWELFTETFARVQLGWTGDVAHEWASFIRAAVKQEDAANLFAAIVHGDVRGDLPLIRAPTLVLYEGEGRRDFADSAAYVAANIPGAKLVALPHGMVPVYDSEAGIGAIEGFLGDDHAPAARAALPPVASSGTAVILFADIADSTALTERLGDGVFRERARALDGALRAAITDAGGTAIEGKLLGDGVLAVFSSARDAIECALAIQRMTAGEGGGLDPRPSTRDPLLLHLGLHAGDVIREEGNVYGGAVNIAARISGEASPGEVLVSQTVRDLARTSAGVSFEDRGERALKGVGEPVRVFVVRGS
jgi:class 3 adenylate cyclase/pimeloyl-ACP methyl ester carboxylesterase